MKLALYCLMPILAAPLLSQQVVTRPILAPATTAQAAAPAASNASSPIVDPSEYRIGPEDMLNVSVWKEPGISGSFPVRPDGMISLALIGDLPAEGLTPTELSDSIKTRLQKFLHEPSVVVTILAVHPKQIFLLGEVQHAGGVTFVPGMTPLQAIALSGGLTPYANAKHIAILRTTGGKQQRLPYDYKKAIKDGSPQGVILMPGDTILIP